MNDGSSAVSVSVTPPDLCDGEFHLVTGMGITHTAYNHRFGILNSGVAVPCPSVSKQQEVITLTVDSMSDQKASPSMSTSISTILDSLYIGGKAIKPFTGYLPQNMIFCEITHTGG